MLCGLVTWDLMLSSCWADLQQEPPGPNPHGFQKGLMSMRQMWDLSMLFLGTLAMAMARYYRLPEILSWQARSHWCCGSLRPSSELHRLGQGNSGLPADVVPASRRLGQGNLGLPADAMCVCLCSSLSFFPAGGRRQATTSQDTGGHWCIHSSRTRVSLLEKSTADMHPLDIGSGAACDGSHSREWGRFYFPRCWTNHSPARYGDNWSRCRWCGVVIRPLALRSCGPGVVDSYAVYCPFALRLCGPGVDGGDGGSPGFAVHR